jgi:kynurenine 3-monooxygenase
MVQKSSALVVILIVAGCLVCTAAAFVMIPPESHRPTVRTNGVYVSRRKKHSTLIRLHGSSRSSSSSVMKDEPFDTTDILICGGGPTGLLAAIMLAQKYPWARTRVYDRQQTPASPTDDAVWDETSRHYLIGLGGRGLTSLEAYGIDILPFAVPVPGRKDWTPEQPDGVEVIRSERKYGTHVLPRDKLVSILHSIIVKEYSDRVDLHFQSQVRPVEFDYGNDQVLVEVSSIGDDDDWTRIVADMVIVADGSARTFANRMEELDASSSSRDNPFRVVRFQDDNERVYKTLPFRLPEKQWLINNPSLHQDILWNYAVRSESSRIIFDALPANDRGDYVGILLMRGEDEMAKPNVDPDAFARFLRNEVPQLFDLIDSDTITSAAAMKSSLLPQFRYVTPRMYQGKRTVLLGDCAHNVKPFFGMGCNTALEDVKQFGEYLEKSPDDWTKAIHAFSEARTPDMKTLVETSRDLDRPGVIGIFTFLIPIILDGIFFKLMPQVFEPNIIALMQNEEYTFQGAVRRKQQDRAGQLFILGTFLYVVGVTFSAMARVLGSSLVTSS